MKDADLREYTSAMVGENKPFVGFLEWARKAINALVRWVEKNDSQKLPITTVVVSNDGYPYYAQVPLKINGPVT